MPLVMFNSWINSLMLFNGGSQSNTKDCEKNSYAYILTASNIKIENFKIKKVVLTRIGIICVTNDERILFIWTFNIDIAECKFYP